MTKTGGPGVLGGLDECPRTTCRLENHAVGEPNLRCVHHAHQLIGEILGKRSRSVVLLLARDPGVAGANANGWGAGGHR